MRRIKIISRMAIVTIFLFLPLYVNAAMVGGNSILQRDTRDGATGTTYIDMAHTIQTDSELTGWNIWARSYAKRWPYSMEPREIELVIFRSVGSDFEVIGKSDTETIQNWDMAYHFDLTTPINAKAGDFIGWYNPPASVPGGVISFGDDPNSLTYWVYNNYTEGLIPQSTFNNQGTRIYSINVEGNPVPIPAAIWLFGSGLIGFVGIRRRIKK